jgi:tetratricopeptide (TPR) repeat protein
VEVRKWCAILWFAFAFSEFAFGESAAKAAVRQIQAGDFRGASELLTGAVKSNPRDVELWNLLGVAEGEQNHISAARQAFERGLAISPSSKSLNENAGLLCFKAGDYSAAKRFLLKARVLGSNNAGVLFSLAASELRTGQQALALNELRNLEGELQQNPEYWKERGRAELPVDAKASEGSFERVLSLNPTDPEALNEAAEAAEKQGLDEKALAYVIRARTATPDDPQTLAHFGALCIRRDLGPDAVAALERAHQLGPKNDSILFLLARANISVQNWQKAYDLFELFSKRHPREASSRYAMGWLDVKLNRLADARKQLTQALILNAKLSGARYELAKLDYDDGQVENARTNLKRVLQEDPHQAEAKVTLADILVREGDLPAAQRLLEEAIQEQPALAAAHYKLSSVYSRLHQAEKAAEEKKIAADLNSKAQSAAKTQLTLVLPDTKETIK